MNLNKRLNTLEYRVLLTPYGRELVDSIYKDQSRSMDYLDKNCPGWRKQTEPPKAHAITIEDNDDE